MDTSIYYDISNTITYDALYNFIIGERLVGVVKHILVKNLLLEDI